MKNVKKIWFIIALALPLLILSSCSDDDDPVDPTIDTTDDEVFIEQQTSGIDVGLGEMALMSASLLGDFELGTIEDGVIDFGDMALGIGANAYLVRYPMSITLPEAEEAASAQAASSWKPYTTQMSFDPVKVAKVRELFEKVISKQAQVAAPAPAAPLKPATKVVKVADVASMLR